MHWKGYAGMVGGVGGELGCEGAFLLHALQLLRKAVMSAVMPGQKMELSALEHICVIP